MNALQSIRVVRPGEVVCTDAGVVKTLLGSCIAVVLWHPLRRVGGMCHFVLPTRGLADPPDGRYGDEALSIMAARMRRLGTQPTEYHAGVYGGGNMFPDHAMEAGSRVGEQNIVMARRLVRRYRLDLRQEEVGGCVHRNVALDLASGRATVTATAVAARRQGA